MVAAAVAGLAADFAVELDDVAAGIVAAAVVVAAANVFVAAVPSMPRVSAQ